MRLDPSVLIILTIVPALYHKRRTKDPSGHINRHEEPSIRSTPTHHQHRPSQKRRKLSHPAETTQEQAYCSCWQKMYAF